METKTLTPAQHKLLRAVVDSQYHDGQHPVRNAVWSEDIHHDMGVSAASAGGIVSAAQQAGLVGTQGGWDKGAGRSEAKIWITQLGYDSLMAADATGSARE